MTSLRRRQIRSAADDEDFLTTIRNLHFEICALELENRELTERRTQLHQQLFGVERTEDCSPVNENKRPMFKFRAQTSQFLTALAVEESSQTRSGLNHRQVPLSVPQRLRDTLSRLHWRMALEKEDSEDSNSSEEVETEEVTSQEPEGEGNHQEGPKEDETLSESGQEVTGKRHGKIWRCFAAVWSCAWD